MRHSFSTFVLCVFTASPLLGANWEEGIARGMTTLSTSVDGGSVVLVCDPDRVFNPEKSNANFVVTMPKDKAASQIVFLAGSGQQAAFSVRDGVATQLDADPQAWATLKRFLLILNCYVIPTGAFF